MGLANAISSYSASFAVPEGTQIQRKKGDSTVNSGRIMDIVIG